MNSLPDVILRLTPPDRRSVDVVVSGVTPRTTVADLAALVTPSSIPIELTIDGRRLAAATALVDTGARHGSELEWATTAIPSTGRPVVVGHCVGGPDWGRELRFPAGRHVVGRATGPAGVGCNGIDDPSMAPRHVVVEPGTDATVEVEDLGVGCPPRWIGDLLRVGSSDLRFEPIPAERSDPAAAGEASGGWHTVLVRPPRAAPVRADTIRPFEVTAPPERSATGIGVVSTGVAAIGGAVVGLVLRQPLMVVLSVLGTLGGVATLGVQTWRDRRARRRHRQAEAVEVERFHHELDAAVARMEHRLRPTAPWRVGTDVVVSDLWTERLRPGQLWSPTIGTGDLEWEPPIDGGGDPVTLEHVAVPLELHQGAVAAFVGDPAGVDRMVRSLVMQAAVTFGPADLRIVGDPGALAPTWRRWLPHHEDRLDPDGDDDRTTLLVLGSSRNLTVRTSAARRRLDRSADRTITIVACRADDPVPQLCTHVVRLGSGGGAEIHHLAPSPGAEFARPGTVHRVDSCGIGEHAAERLARVLARFVDPELPAGRAALPDRVEFGDLLDGDHMTPEGIAARWQRAGHDPAPTLTLGIAADGRIELDLHRDGPHALIAGTTGSGKSELLRSLVAGLAMSAPPHLLQFVLVDYKGGSAFDACGSLPHVAGMVTDLDGRLAERMLASLEAELKRRERVFRDHGVADLTACRRAGGPAVSRLVVVVDEFAALATELPDFLASLIGVAQRGRSLGVHLVLATQRPAGVVDDDIRANTDLRLCLRVQDPADALDVVGDRRAAELPRATPGRAVLRLGSEPIVVFQTACCTGPERSGEPGLRIRPLGPCDVGVAPVAPAHPEVAGPTFLEGLVARIRAASRPDGPSAIGAPVWTEPLPAVLAVPDDGFVGQIDDVRAQTRRSLVWQPGGGHLLIAGRRGAGVSSALTRVATSVAASAGPDEVHLFVVDGSGAGSLAALAGLPHCGAVIDGNDTDDVERVLTLLERRGGGASTVVVIDDAGAFRSRLSSPDLFEVAERWNRLVTDTASSITFVFGVDHPSAIPMTWQGRCAHRWVGSLADPLDSAAFGVPAAWALRNAPPGRFVVAADDGTPLDAQIAWETGATAAAVARICARWRDRPSTVTRLATAPAMISARDLPAPTARSIGGSSEIDLPIGVRAVTFEPVSVTLRPGDHGLVLGPRRSGRTSFLRLLLDEWEQLFGPGAAALVTGRDRSERGLSRRVDDVIGSGRRCLIVIDDAEQYADTDHAVAEALADERGEVHVVAAGRPDAIRSCGYGHWTAALRRPAFGLLLGAVSDADTELLGLVVPRRRASERPRPAGTGFLSADGMVHPVRVAAGRLDGDQRGGVALAGSVGQECFG